VPRCQFGAHPCQHLAATNISLSFFSSNKFDGARLSANVATCFMLAVLRYCFVRRTSLFFSNH
jgi:hypothetical protein